ncbi:hypothetical protein BH23ACT3_BH23ACT3_22610 [soil metagenome]
MSVLPATILSFARAHHGVLSADLLSTSGVGRHARARLVRQGFLQPMHVGVYRISSHPMTFEQQCVAACFTADDLVICGPSAGRLIGLRRMPRGPVHAMVERRKIDLDRVVVHRTTTLGPGDIAFRSDGIRLLKPSRLVPDLARFLDDLDLESVIDQLLDRRSTSIPSLCASARRLRSPGRDGTARLGRVLEARPAWLKPKDSHLEVNVLRALADRGIPLVPQFELDIGEVVPIHLDGADPEIRFGLEVDHVSWHGGRVEAQRDKRRDRRALQIGWLVTRVTDEDLELDFDGVIAEVVDIHRQQSQRKWAS